MVQFRLSLVVSDIMLTWYRATFVPTLFPGYEIDFIALIRLDICARAFGETTTILLSCLIQKLCYAGSVSDIHNIDHRNEVTSITNINFLKNLIN